MSKYPSYIQLDAQDCAPTCLKMVTEYYNARFSREDLRKLTKTKKVGTTLKNLSTAADEIGFHSRGVRLSLNGLKEVLNGPVILFWEQKHYVVLYKITKKQVVLGDPAIGIIHLSQDEFLRKWNNLFTADDPSGIALLLTPTPKLLTYNKTESRSDRELTARDGLLQALKYLKFHRLTLIQLVIGVICMSIIQMIGPFLTQSIVDIGIQNNNINFIYLVLAGQVILFLGSSFIMFIRGWLLLYLTTIINITLISDFFIKLMKLPISFFESRVRGDILQRIEDHGRIKNFITVQSLSALYSVITLVLLGGVLAYYSLSIFVVFITGTIVYLGWFYLFLNRRKIYDNERFSEMSKETSKVIELLNGMQEIKLNNAENKKRWEWENIQASLFKVELKFLKLQQSQFFGANFINEFKNILITILAAKLTLEGRLTLGMLLSVTFIVGQLNVPVKDILQMILSYQDAKISLDRLADIRNRANEEQSTQELDPRIVERGDIVVKNLNFSYGSVGGFKISNLNFSIPKDKITAIVGASGCGKTTLMKLLLKYYEIDDESVTVDGVDLNKISHSLWRERCGVVMQDSYIFNDTIANNIALSDDYPDIESLREALQISNSQDIVDNLPLSYNTKIGADGIGLSGGQKQRIVISRAVYQKPDYIFFDEATSALDATNELIIMENLTEFFRGRTAVVIAHRLSTVKNADQILVMANGEIVESGTHDELLSLRGPYFNLVKNQLDLEKIGSANH